MEIAGSTSSLMATKMTRLCDALCSLKRLGMHNSRQLTSSILRAKYILDVANREEMVLLFPLSLQGHSTVGTAYERSVSGEDSSPLVLHPAVRKPVSYL